MEPLAPGSEELSHYKVLDKLGEGGMGVLCRARDTRLDRTVALKLLRSQVVGEEDQRWRFVQEARAASALNHPNIVTIYEIDRQPGDAGADFIVMEYVDGQALSRVLADRRLGVEEALALAAPVASAGRRPCRGHRAPRREAGQRDGHGLGCGEGARLRSRQAERRRSGRPHPPGLVLS